MASDAKENEAFSRRLRQTLTAAGTDDRSPTREMILSTLRVQRER